MSGYYAYFTGDDGHITNRVTFLAAYVKKPKNWPSNWLTATRQREIRIAAISQVIADRIPKKWPRSAL